ncbi:MAG: adenine phosphoribosyltransferase [Deltaproteobacteria bacterium]|nr:adenine phosphoribosyltransferase [Deltaproteobacteria bacterium]
MDQIKNLIRTIPNFPKPGIMFRDVTTLFLDPQGLRLTIEEMAKAFRGHKIDMVVGVESRGFILGAPLAVALGTGFVPVRKPGKLPGEKIGVEYALEYGTDRLEIHTNALEKGMRVLMVDDLIATGGTMAAACHLVEQVGGEVAHLAFVVELPDLKGRDKLKKYPIFTLVEFEGD